jgi:predicted LPLAT superfamily acyltransferase
LFPFTIYHLAMLFDRPVVFCTGVPGETDNELRVFASPVFTPNPTADREANTRAAWQHFQDVLTQLEGLVRQHPFLWFNFLPLNPEMPASSRHQFPIPLGAHRVRTE